MVTTEFFLSRSHLMSLLAIFLSIGIEYCNTLNTSNLSEELWHRTLSFVDMKDPKTSHLPALNRRTYQFYDSDYATINQLESIIYGMNHINQTVDYELVWRLSKQLQLSSVEIIRQRYNQVYNYVSHQLLAAAPSQQNTPNMYFVNPNARHLMHALGYRSISIHEYNAMTLDDDVFVININITESGKQKLRLLLLASKATQTFETAVLDLSKEEMNDPRAHELAYMKMEQVVNTASRSIWIWSHFPWLAAPQYSWVFHTHSFLLYFGCLYDFLWSRYHHEFGFPEFHSVRYISDFDDEELLEKLKFVKYLMDKYRFRLHRQFKVTKREIIRWMNDHYSNGS